MCWGSNVRGQLGLGHTNNFHGPSPVINTYDNPITIGAGAAHNCIKNDNGNLKCWGSNILYQIFQDEQKVKASPFNSHVLFDVIEIVGGDFHTCVKDSFGELKSPTHGGVRPFWPPPTCYSPQTPFPYAAESC